MNNRKVSQSQSQGREKPAQAFLNHVVMRTPRTEIALTEAELKNTDRSGDIQKGQSYKGAKIQERILVTGDQWGKMSLGDVREENMTGFWNGLKVKNKAYSVEKKHKSSLHNCLRSSPEESQR